MCGPRLGLGISPLGLLVLSVPVFILPWHPGFCLPNTWCFQLRLGHWPLQGSNAQRELKWKCFFGPVFSLDIIHYSLFSSFPCLWPNRQHELHGRTAIMTWNIVVEFLNWRIIAWYIVPHELDASRKPSFLGKFYFGGWSMRKIIEGPYTLSFIHWMHIEYPPLASH